MIAQEMKVNKILFSDVHSICA